MTNSLLWKTTAAEDGDCAIFTDGAKQELIGVAASPKQAVEIVKKHNFVFAPSPELAKSEPLVVYFNNEVEREEFIRASAEQFGWKSHKL